LHPCPPGRFPQQVLPLCLLNFRSLFQLRSEVAYRDILSLVSRPSIFLPKRALDANPALSPLSRKQSLFSTFSKETIPTQEIIERPTPNIFSFLEFSSRHACERFFLTFFICFSPFLDPTFPDTALSAKLSPQSCAHLVSSFSALCLDDVGPAGFFKAPFRVEFQVFGEQLCPPSQLPVSTARPSPLAPSGRLQPHVMIASPPCPLYQVCAEGSSAPHPCPFFPPN